MHVRVNNVCVKKKIESYRDVGMPCWARVFGVFGSKHNIWRIWILRGAVPTAGDET